ncbi:MAG: hypothetical protein EOO14_00365 [Chitinophagaceae bacterium]|nr:MAG: hypothetical protein EOO14_00365 [Chitinophagaceae bacterium]
MKKYLLLLFLCIGSFCQAQKLLNQAQRNGSTDRYPIVTDSLVKGGFQVVADTTARNDIYSEMRKEGMVVYTAADTTWWQLLGGISNSNWVASFKNTASGNSAFIKNQFAVAQNANLWINGKGWFNDTLKAKVIALNGDNGPRGIYLYSNDGTVIASLYATGGIPSSSTGLRTPVLQLNNYSDTRYNAYIFGSDAQFRGAGVRIYNPTRIDQTAVTYSTIVYPWETSGGFQPLAALPAAAGTLALRVNGVGADSTGNINLSFDTLLATPNLQQVLNEGNTATQGATFGSTVVAPGFNLTSGGANVSLRPQSDAGSIIAYFPMRSTDQNIVYEQDMMDSLNNRASRISKTTTATTSLSTMATIDCSTPSAVYTLKITIAGINSAGNAGSYKLFAAVKNVGGTLTIIEQLGEQSIADASFESGSFSIAVATSGTNALINVTPGTSLSTAWTVSYEITKAAL